MIREEEMEYQLHEHNTSIHYPVLANLEREHLPRIVRMLLLVHFGGNVDVSERE